MKTYSTYEAKARLSELLDRVEKGDVVTITRHGEPVAEVRPIDQPAHSFSRRVDELRRRGVLSEPGRRLKASPLARRKGALRRFLDARE